MRRIVMLVLVCALSGCGVASGTDVPLPWPDEGQAAVEVVGVGRLGSSGGAEPVPIASVTKVMTAYVLLRRHPLKPSGQGPLITVDRTAAEESFLPQESTVPLVEGRRIRLRRLLELMLVPSGNNAARLLARWDAGSEERFAVRMNAAARRLGMSATTYTGGPAASRTARSAPRPTSSSWPGRPCATRSSARWWHRRTPPCRATPGGCPAPTRCWAGTASSASRPAPGRRRAAT
ncbi:serine hydrolase [Nonomuraea salmonea]|uniref:serine hydrolase n=1 Tax=Nonomuraea salmonea TaxID=46181 RepID=UPI0031F0C67E